MYELIYFGIGFVIAAFMWYSHLQCESREYMRPGDDAGAFIICIMMIFAWGFLVPALFIIATWDWTSYQLARRKQRHNERNTRV